MLAKHCLPKLTNTFRHSQKRKDSQQPQKTARLSQHFQTAQVYTCALGWWEHRACASAAMQDCSAQSWISRARLGSRSCCSPGQHGWDRSRSWSPKQRWKMDTPALCSSLSAQGHLLMAQIAQSCSLCCTLAHRQHQEAGS